MSEADLMLRQAERIIAIANKEGSDEWTVGADLMRDYAAFVQSYIDLLNDESVWGDEFLRRLRAKSAEDFVERWLIERETGGVQ